MTSLYWILFIGIALASWIVSASLERKFKRYAQESLPMTGKDVAEKMLHDNGIYDVKITCIKGQLTDHYNPATKTVNLSEDVYRGANVAAAAVAAHECGHAVQHATLGGLLLLGSGAGQMLLFVGIGLYAMITLFSFITLPVEMNASQRAVNWLQEAGITNRETTAMASDALHSAACTYVVAALSSLATLIYYILVFMGGSRR